MWKKTGGCVSECVETQKRNITRKMKKEQLSTQLNFFQFADFGQVCFLNV